VILQSDYCKVFLLSLKDNENRSQWLTQVLQRLDLLDDTKSINIESEEYLKKVKVKEDSDQLLAIVRRQVKDCAQILNRAQEHKNQLFTYLVEGKEKELKKELGEDSGFLAFVQFHLANVCWEDS